MRAFKRREMCGYVAAWFRQGANKGAFKAAEVSKTNDRELYQRGGFYLPFFGTSRRCLNPTLEESKSQHHGLPLFFTACQFLLGLKDVQLKWPLSISPSVEQKS